MFDLIKEVYDNFKSNNKEAAQAAQLRVDRIISVLLEYKTIPFTKVILEEMGFPVGNAVFPMKRYSEQERQRIVSKMKNAGFQF